MKKLLLFTALILIPIFGYLFWHASTTPATLTEIASTYPTIGTKVTENLTSLPTLPITEGEQSFVIEDTQKEGISIQYASQTDNSQPTTDNLFQLSFPKDSTKPLEVKLDEERSIPITHLDQETYTLDTLTRDRSTGDLPGIEGSQTLWQRLTAPSSELPPTYLRYQGDRKTLLYAYERDGATGERRLKHWTLYESGTGLEEERYHLENVKLKINEGGDAEVFYYGEQDLQNEAVKAEVEPSLMERAQRTLEKELGQDMLNNSTPDFVIPKPYYLDNQGERHDLEWKWNEESKILSVTIDLASQQQSGSTALYPIALDPTLSFTAPGQSNTGSVIDGESTSSFGSSLVAGDFNSDGKMDLAVGANTYSSFTGGTFIFYGDGSMPVTAAAADVTIIGETTSDAFGSSLAVGDFNADGRTDLAVGAYNYSSSSGRTYIFYNDGSIPTTAGSADVAIDGQTIDSAFGISLAAGDFNADGRTDLAVGAYGYSAVSGRAHIFYNDGSIPTTAGTADVTISGEASSSFGIFLIAGDFNSDGRVDLTVGAFSYSSSTGRAYIFYNDGSIPTTAGTADVTITGGATSNYFGVSLTAGDFNSDGRTDLAVGAYRYSTYTGRTYIFYNDGSIPTTAGTADVIITGEATGGYFGYSLASGDFNADGRTDLAVGAYNYSSSFGRTYIFYNDGSIPTTAGTADVIITGEATGGYFGYSLASGDFNADGRTDLAVGAFNYSSSTGRAYIFYSQNGQVNTNFTITGNATSDQFGYAMTTGDVNADGRTDLIVGAPGYSTSTGRAYIFYGDGQIPTTAGTADVTITGEATSNYFGGALSTGDFNADGETDLVVGAVGYSTNTGRAYIFYNDGSIPTTAGTADVTITGNASGDSFGATLAVGDFNFDARNDLVVGSINYSSSTGRAYIFYNDGSIPTTAGTADVTITGEATSNYFGIALTAGDFNADGRTDLAVGAQGYSTDTGRAYIFYNDGSIPTTAGTADVTITGEATSNYFGIALTAGDFNADGRADLAVGAYGYSSVSGRAYIFYNDGSIPTTAGTADVTITGEATSNYFGIALTAGDFNADGRTDLAVGAQGYSTDTGRAYIFYNDGSLPTTAGTADVTITGETAGDNFSATLSSGDLNGDGRIDLVVGSYYNASDTGKVYLYETRENFAWEIQKQPQPASGALRTGLDTSGQEMRITGEAGSAFGTALTTGDLNSDGKPDLIVGASSYSTSTGRVYIFYSDGSLATRASSADVVITGETTSSGFGITLTTGDLNSDGRVDLVVGASSYSTNTGRAYIFYNDGSIPTTAGTADVTIAGNATSDNFGAALSSGDLNADGKTDLIVGAFGHSSNTGRAYIFYNDGSIPTTAGTADVTITGQGIVDYFGYALATGDFNADGRTDLAVAALLYPTGNSSGRAYIFYNDGSIPTTAATADVTITGEATGNLFGSYFAVGDFNSDGRTDLAIGAAGYSSGTGRAYIFYNDGSIPTTAGTADVTITGGATSNNFGVSLAAGDWNADGRTDLVVGANGYTTNTGRAYIFYNDGSIPTTAATADITFTGEATGGYFGNSFAAGDFNSDGRTDLAIGAHQFSSLTGRVYLYTFGNDPVITGETTNNYFGYTLTTGDLNADGKIDLIVGAYGYSSNAGRVYIFYNDGAYPSAVASADVTITGNAASDEFGRALTTGDFNFDGKADLAVGASGYSFSAGRVYLFYGDGSIPTTAGTADVTITGDTLVSNYFGGALTSGDLNSDGRTDLVVGSRSYSTNTGRAYIFYNDGSIPTTEATADVTITGEATSNYFGSSLTTGDFNADGKIDLAVGAYGYSSSTGRAYIFYNDGSIPTTAATADVTITGEATSNLFGVLAAGDFNADGRIDLVVGAQGYSSSTGRAYIFYNDGSIPTTAATADVTITGVTTGNYFGILAAGDFNADGRTDLAVSGFNAASTYGAAYIFYNDGSIPTTAATADVTMTGETSGSSFSSLSTGDFNSDGKTDLAVGAYGYSTNTGRVYVFTSETATTSAQPATGYLKGTGKLKGTAKLR